MKSEWGPCGLDIELGEMIAKELGMEAEFIMTDSVKEVLGMVEDGEADLGMAGITVTHKRSQSVKFSHPYWRGGVGLMANKQTGNTFMGFVKKLPKVWPIIKVNLVILFIILTIFALMILPIERKNGDETHFSEKFWKGLAQSYWWALVTSTTVGYGDVVPQTNKGRLVAAMVMVCGICWFGFFMGSTGAVVSILVDDITIEGVQDFAGKKVATKQGSTAEKYLSIGASEVVPYVDITKACNDCAEGKVAAVVFDAPALQRFAAGNSKVVVLPNMIKDEDYAVAMSKDCPYAEQINEAVLQFKDDGRIQSLSTEWVDNPKW